MAALTLVDTNVLLRLLQPQHPQHAMATKSIARLQDQQVELFIAPQNLVEFWVVATRPVANNGIGLTPAAVASEVQAIQGVFDVLEGKAGVTAAWEGLVARHRVSGKTAHDVHLVATMQVYGVSEILTFNVSDFRRFPGIVVLDPAQF